MSSTTRDGTKEQTRIEPGKVLEKDLEWILYVTNDLHGKLSRNLRVRNLSLTRKISMVDWD